MFCLILGPNMRSKLHKMCIRIKASQMSFFWDEMSFLQPKYIVVKRQIYERKSVTDSILTNTNNAPPKFGAVEFLYALPRNSSTCHLIFLLISNQKHMPVVRMSARAITKTTERYPDHLFCWAKL